MEGCLFPAHFRIGASERADPISGQRQLFLCGGWGIVCARRATERPLKVVTNECRLLFQFLMFIRLSERPGLARPRCVRGTSKHRNTPGAGCRLLPRSPETRGPCVIRALNLKTFPKQRERRVERRCSLWCEVRRAAAAAAVNQLPVLTGTLRPGIPGHVLCVAW